ncbi:response regulator [Lacticaseibacillus daqingensis]|uniref:response regulator n=1 Tax=Lacticaseibacillus daqingensis TaxID=2486014 RepID=UPI000F78B54B|nr:response regulator [Lacticaseibacillus daqingensis]
MTKRMQVVLIDDEPLALMGINHLLDAYSEQFAIAGSFSSSLQAQAFLQANPDVIDLVITDINMPELSGIDLIGALQAITPNLTFIILTGYGTLDYAKQAMRLGVKYFLQKPILGNELDDTLTAVRNDIQQRHRVSILNQKEALKRALLSTTEPTLDEIDQFSVLIYAEQYYQALQPSIDRLLDPASVGTINVEGLVLTYISPIVPLSSIHLNKLPQQAAVIYYRRRVNVSILRADLPVIKQLMRLSFYQRGLLVVDADHLRLTTTDRLTVQTHLTELITLIEIDHGDLPSAMIQQLIDTARDAHLPPKELIRLIQSRLSRTLLSQPDNPPTLSAAIQQLTTVSDAEALRSQLIALTRLARQHPRQADQSIHHSIRINAIIAAHFAKSDLSLRSISKQYLFLNPDYLGKKYFQETGEHFTTHLLKVRMNHATQLLEQGYPVATVAKKTGYENNPDYFSQQFKRFTGETPRQYQKYHLGRDRS